MQIRCFYDINFQQEGPTVQLGNPLPGNREDADFSGSAFSKKMSSFIIEGVQDGDWVEFSESLTGDGADHLWMQGSGALRRLDLLQRPHGTNNWNDVIQSVKFYGSTGPSDANSNYGGGFADPSNQTVVSHDDRQYRVDNDTLCNMRPEETYPSFPLA